MQALRKYAARVTSILTQHTKRGSQWHTVLNLARGGNKSMAAQIVLRIKDHG